MTTFLKNITKSSIISIIGLAKNVSKTTTLNYLISNLAEKYKLGLTSIGRDGEKYDVITQLPKPRIFIKEGTYIATAKQCFEKSQIDFDILKITKFNTPLGKIYILKSLNEGYIELAGPSINRDLYEICLELKKLGCDLILIDGAFDRRSYATPLISDATIVSTGASVSENMKDVINITKHVIELLSLENEKNHEIIDLANDALKKSKVSIIDNENTVKFLDVLTPLGSAKDITDYLDKNSNYVVIKGAITDKLLEDLMQITEKYKGVTFLAEDATKLFLSENTMKHFQKKGGILKILNPIKIIAITINPTSPNGYKFNKDEFLKQLKENINIPVYNLVENE